MQENNSSQQSCLQMITLFKGASRRWRVASFRLLSSHIPVRTGLNWPTTSAELEQAILPCRISSGLTPGIRVRIQKGTEKDNNN